MVDDVSLTEVAAPTELEMVLVVRSEERALEARSTRSELAEERSVILNKEGLLPRAMASRKRESMSTSRRKGVRYDGVFDPLESPPFGSK